MLQAFIIILREGFEAFLLVAIVLAYLRRTGRTWSIPAVYWGLVASVVASVGLGYLLKNGVDEALLQKVIGARLAASATRFFNIESWREAVLGVVTILFVGTLVIHMWRTGPSAKRDMEQRLDVAASRSSRFLALGGIFLFTVLMITREGMETALLLLQVHDRQWVYGALFGVGAAALMAWAWSKFGQLVNLKRFFQVTAIFLMLFMVQVAIYTFHEFTEAGVFPNSEALHVATEPFSPVGLYGKWFSPLMIAVCACWLVGAHFVDRSKTKSKRGPLQPLGHGSH